MAVVLPHPVKLHTSDELFALPADMRYELIRGELVEMPPSPGAEHGDKTIRLSARATVFADDNDLGVCFAAETGFKVESDPDTVIAPDWAFVSQERVPHPIPQKYIPFAPDIVLETRSPFASDRDVAKKVAIWLSAGVRIVWELNPRRQQLIIHRSGQPPRFLGPADTLTGEEVLPGFEFPMARLFAQPPAEDDSPG